MGAIGDVYESMSRASSWMVGCFLVHTASKFYEVSGTIVDRHGHCTLPPFLGHE